MQIVRELTIYGLELPLLLLTSAVVSSETIKDANSFREISAKLDKQE